MPLKRLPAPRPARAATTRQAMRLSILDGLFATQYVTLTGGTLLTAFLVTLGATEIEIGLVAALPLLGQLVQPAGAEVIRRRSGWRKGLVVGAALTDVLLWGVSAAAVAWLDRASALAVVLGVLALQQLPTAFVSVGWTSWMSDLIPPRLRGRFFGHRNFVCNGFAAITALGAGQVIGAAEDPIPMYLLAIGVGAAARLVSLHFLHAQPEPRPAASPEGGFWSQLRLPLGHAGFRRYLVYNAAWGFGVQFAAPFFTVFMLTEGAVGPGTVMLIASLGTVANLAGQRVWGPLADRYGERQVMRVAGIAVVFQPAWWLLAGPSDVGYAVMVGASVMGGFLWGGHLLATGNLMMRLAPETGKTAFFAVQAAMAGLAGALGPIAGGALAEAVTAGALGTGLPQTLKVVFAVSAALRLGAWMLLARVPEPEPRPRLRVVVLIRDTARTFNPVQGFSPLLHVFAAATAAPRSLARRWRQPRAQHARTAKAER